MFSCFRGSTASAVADFMMRKDRQKTVLEQMVATSKGTMNGFELLFEVVSLD